MEIITGRKKIVTTREQPLPLFLLLMDSFTGGTENGGEITGIKKMNVKGQDDESVSSVYCLCGGWTVPAMTLCPC